MAHKTRPFKDFYTSIYEGPEVICYVELDVFVMCGAEQSLV